MDLAPWNTCLLQTRVGGVTIDTRRSSTAEVGSAACRCNNNKKILYDDDGLDGGKEKEEEDDVMNLRRRE